MKLVNRTFETLCGLGTVNRNNRRTTRTSSNRVGVAVSQSGAKKATTLEILVPTRRSRVGSRRMAKMVLSGRQARRLYEELRTVYELGLINNS